MVKRRNGTGSGRVMLGAGIAFLMAACGDQREVTAPGESTAEVLPASTVLQHLKGTDREFAELARQIPGFAGFYFDADGAVIVRLVDVARQDIARTILSEALRSRGRQPTEMKFAPAEYDFAQLAVWRGHFPTIQSIEGVVSTGIDERANRLRFGVVDESARLRVVAALSRVGIPQDAATIVVVPPTKRYTSLSSYTRPVPGGVQAEFYTGSYNAACTVGFSAYTYGESDMKFLTNSHCTEIQGQVEFTNFYQPTRTSTDYRIGIEVEDPSFATGGVCPAGYYCRYSDAAVATYYGAEGDFGKLARTIERSTGSSGSTTIDSNNPRLNVISKFDYPYDGETLDKVGITTGWTTGQVFDSCTDISAGDVWLWCQDKVSAGAWYGDSGSPVFYFRNGSDAVLVGLLWGGPGVSPDDKVFYMSSISGMGADGIDITRVY